jgi:hypothetical protein
VRAGGQDGADLGDDGFDERGPFGCGCGSCLIELVVDRPELGHPLRQQLDVYGVGGGAGGEHPEAGAVEALGRGLGGHQFEAAGELADVGLHAVDFGVRQ